MDGADFFWTSGNCSTMVLPDSGIVGNEAPRPPSTGGISETWHRGTYGKKTVSSFFSCKVGSNKNPLANILILNWTIWNHPPIRNSWIKMPRGGALDPKVARVMIIGFMVWKTCWYMLTFNNCIYSIVLPCFEFMLYNNRNLSYI